VAERAGDRRRPQRCRRGQRGRRPRARPLPGAASRRRASARLPMARVALDRPHDFGCDAREQSRRRSTDPQGLSRRARGSLPAAGDGPEGSPRLAALRRPQRPAADFDSGRIGRDAARRRHAVRPRGGPRRRARDARNLAAYDPCRRCGTRGSSRAAGRWRARASSSAGICDPRNFACSRACQIRSIQAGKRFAPRGRRPNP